MTSYARNIFPVILALIASAPMTAQAQSSPQMTVPIVTDAPVIDGKVTPEEQASAHEVTLQKVASLDKPRFATKVFVEATLEGLYIGFIAEDPAIDSLVSNTETENGAVFNDDSVQVLITPTLDTAADAYYHFAVNPDGTRYSSHIIERENVQGWKSAVSKVASNEDSSGKIGHWEAEFFIPLKSIKAPDELPVWRANFARYRAARADQPAETTAWVDPGISLHNYKKFGYLTMPRFVPEAPGGGSTIADSTSTDVTTTATLTTPSTATLSGDELTSMPVSTTP